MKRVSLLISLLLFVSLSFGQVTTKVESFNHCGPYTVNTPYFTDSLGVKGKAFDEKNLMDAISFSIERSTPFSEKLIPSDENEKTLNLFSFYINNLNFIKAKLKVKTSAEYKAFVDGKPVTPEMKLEPKQHRIDIKTLSKKGATDSLSVSLSSDKEIETTLSPKHGFSMDEVLYGKNVTSARISPDGKYIIVGYSETDQTGRSLVSTQMREVKSNRLILEKNGINWLSNGNEFYYESNRGGVRRLYKASAEDLTPVLICENIPKGRITISPDESYLILTDSEEGPKEDPNVFQIVYPDDRQPGWRNRSFITKYDIKTGVNQRIAFGTDNFSLIDISHDSKKLLLGSYHNRIQKRPSRGIDVFLLDLNTNTIDTLIKDEGFVDALFFSPDDKQLLVAGSPEAFGKIGENLEEGQTANIYDKQLFIFDIATKGVRCLTKDFNPSVDGVVWSVRDNQIYAQVTESEYSNLYRFSPDGKKIVKLPTSAEVVSNWYLPKNGQYLSYTGLGASSPKKSYIMDLKALKDYMWEDCTQQRYKDVVMNECIPYTFTNRLGDKIEGRFYLPNGFDPNKQYPLIVNYYGGCSPTTRSLESRYPHQYYASLGYVVYVVQPSGAVGFGQKFSARHVETWGQYVADDIIEGVKNFCKDHPYVNSAKIGCIGASYGGFMTMYLQTVTDIFACAVSHAGISNIASYWGEGYWGYSYGHVASGESYPWNNPEMYTRQSPLFNADKIHTPLLLLHGTADTNVPHIESIQMFTALKMLGREVAFVEVKGENHWILDYPKRIKWSNTIMAWFQKYLKDDPSWWDELYPNKYLE